MLENNILKTKLQNDCGIEFLFDKEVNESEVFDWVFNPYSSSADWIISNLTKHAQNEPEISRFVEVIWNRLSSRFPNRNPTSPTARSLVQRDKSSRLGKYVRRIYKHMKLLEKLLPRHLSILLKDSRCR